MLTRLTRPCSSRIKCPVTNRLMRLRSEAETVHELAWPHRHGAHRHSARAGPLPGWSRRRGKLNLTDRHDVRCRSSGKECNRPTAARSRLRMDRRRGPPDDAGLCRQPGHDRALRCDFWPSPTRHPAAKAKIEPYDVVTAVNGAPLRSWRDFAKIISSMAPDTRVYLTTWRSRQLIDVRVMLGRKQCR